MVCSFACGQMWQAEQCQPSLTLTEIKAKLVRWSQMQPPLALAHTCFAAYGTLCVMPHGTAVLLWSGQLLHGSPGMW